MIMVYRICISDCDKRLKLRIKFVCENVFEALDMPVEFIDITALSMLKDFYNDDGCIYIYAEDNNVIDSEELVDFFILNSIGIRLIVIADSNLKLYRFLPAEPFALINTDSIETEIVSNLRLIAGKNFTQK